MNETRRRHRLLHWSDWSLLAKGLVVVTLPVAALLFSRVSILRSQAATESAQHIVQLSRQQDREITSVRLAMLNAESGVRGFLLTADPSFLAPYKAAQETIDQRLNQPVPRKSPPQERRPREISGRSALRWLRP